MTDYVANRRLYRGAGQFIERGEPVKDLNAADAKRLQASGAIGEPEKKKERKTANKAEGASEKNKSDD